MDKLGSTKTLYLLMKKFLLYATGILTAFSITPAFAGLLIYEPFDYSPGATIIGQTDIYSPGSPTWLRAGTATTPEHQVISPSLTMPSGLPPSIGNAGETIGGQAGGDWTEYARMNLPMEYGASSSLYYSLLLNVPSTTGLTIANSNANANNDGIIAFNNSMGAQSTRPNTWAGELVIRLGATTGTFDLGIRASTTAANTTYWSADLTPGSTYFVVVGWAESATPGTGGLSSLWINPNSSTYGASIAPAADGSTVGTFSATAANDHTDSLILGAGIASGTTPSQTWVDEIRVGDTWADVVPEPSTLTLAGLGALFMVSCYRARRR